MRLKEWPKYAMDGKLHFVRNPRIWGSNRKRNKVDGRESAYGKGKYCIDQKPVISLIFHLYKRDA